MNPLIPSRPQLSRARSVEIYFTCHAQAQHGSFSLVLSWLPSLQSLLLNLPAERFAGRYLIFYFGPHSGLTFDLLSASGVAYESLPFEETSLCSLEATADQLGKLQGMDFSSHDFWCLVLPQKPTVESLKEIGIVSNASALAHPSAPIGQAILLNYFTDPSFHGHEPQDLGYLLEALFDKAFQEAFDFPADAWKPMRTALELETHMALNPSSLLSASISAANMQSFVLRRGRSAKIEQVQWISQQRTFLFWRKERWEGPHAFEPGRVARHWEMVRSYLTPLLLVPIAIVVIPVTLALWPMVAAVRWGLSRRKR